MNRTEASFERLGALKLALGNLGNFVEKRGVCEKHGEFSAVVPPSVEITCRECRDEKAQAEAEARMLADRIAYLRKIARIPPRFAAAGFKDWIPVSSAAEVVKQSVITAFRDLRDNPRQWRPVWLSGVPGTGKTHLVCALANNLIEAGISVRYTTLQAMLADIKSAYSDDTKTEAGQIAQYVRGVDVLVIDEIDVMRATDNDKTLLFEVINGRYNHLAAVVIASNQAPERLGDFVTDRVVDRLRENALTLRCDWASARAGL